MKKVKLFNEFAETPSEEAVNDANAQVAEANADGTISDDEDERREELEIEVYHEAKAFAESVVSRAYEIGGDFRGPGIQADMSKQIKKAFKDAKFRI